MPLSAEARRQQALIEIVRLNDEFENWAGSITKLPQYTTQLESISIEVRACAKRLHDALGNLGAGGSTASVYSRCTRIEKQIAWLWRAWSWFRDKFDQRGDERFGSTLKAADEVIWSCYRPFFSEKLTERVREPAPLPYIEMEFSPIALRRDQSFVLGGKDRAYELLTGSFQKLPIPVLKLPVSSIATPWTLALIGHETGHFVQRLVAPDSAFVKKFRETLEAVDSTWGAWSEEVFADWYSIATMGPWAIWPMAQFEAGDTEISATRRDAYPAPRVRLELLAALADHYGFAGTEMLNGFDLPKPAAGDFPEYDLDSAAVPNIVHALAALPECQAISKRIDPRAEDYQEKGLVDQWSKHIQGLGARPVVGKPSSARLAAAGAARAWDVEVFSPNEPPDEDRVQELRESARAAMTAAAMPGVRSSSASPVPEKQKAGDVLSDFLERVIKEEPE